MKKIACAIYLILLGSLIGLGSFLTVFYLLPFSTLKGWGNSLSKDGNLQSFTPKFYQASQKPGLIMGVLLLFCALLLIYRRPKIQDGIFKGLVWFSDFFRRLLFDAGSFWQDTVRIIPKKFELLALFLMIGIGAFVRLLYINKPMDYDECYTFTEFAQFSFKQVISDYNVPNNHVFHTILVRISYLLFGNAPWAIRIPVYLTGLLIIFMVYLLARRYYNVQTALLAAGLAAMTPDLINYSVNARGYNLVTLMTLFTLLLSMYVSRHKNLFGWFLLIVFSALGFYTIPIMLYPFGVVFTWLFVTGVYGRISAEYQSFKHWLKYFILAGFSSAALTIFLYLPIFFTNGVTNFFNGAKVVESVGFGEFIRTIPARFNVVLQEWTTGTLPVVVWVILVGVILSILLHKKIANGWVSLQASTGYYLVIVLLIQRPNSIARIWLWLLPLIIIWAAAGLVGAFAWIAQRYAFRPRAVTGFVCVSLVVIGSAGIWHAWQDFPRPGQVNYAGQESEAVSRFLKANITPDDVIVISGNENAFYWYYARYVGIPTRNIRSIKSRPFHRAFVVIFPQLGDTVESVIHETGPDYGFFNFDTLKKVNTIAGAEIYTVDAYVDEVNKAYGIQTP